MKILLADAHSEVRAALRLVLEQPLGFHVVGEARDAVELFVQVISGCPDVILLDPDLPGVQFRRKPPDSSLGELIDSLHRLCPSVYVIVLSSLPNLSKGTGLMQADAYACKSDPPDTLLSVLENALQIKK